MNYPIPLSSQEIAALCRHPVREEAVAVAIAGVVTLARGKGQSLDELMAEVLADDRILNLEMRRWLSEIVAQAWMSLP